MGWKVFSLFVDIYGTYCPLMNGYNWPVNRSDLSYGRDLGYSSMTNGTWDSSSRLFSDSCLYGQSIYDPAQSGVTSYMEIDADDIPGYPILMLHYRQA